MVEEAARLLREALAAFRELGLRTREADVLRSSAGMSARKGLIVEARDLLDQAGALRVKAGGRWQHCSGPYSPGAG